MTEGDLVELIRRFSSERYDAALESWLWLEQLEGKKTVFASAFGDLFLQGADGFWFLDLIEGTLSHRWPDAQTLQSEINAREAQDQYLLAGLVEAAGRAGMTPQAEQVLAFEVAPVLGGPLSIENIEVADFVVSVNVAGQIHEQVKDLPPGSKISGISIEGS